MKMKWTAEPDNRFRRAWPIATYANGKPAAQIVCSTMYSRAMASSGNHDTLRIMIADHSKTPFEWRLLKKSAKTIKEAKNIVNDFKKKYPFVCPTKNLVGK